MADTKAILIYVMILLFFNFFAGSFLMSDDEDAQFKLEQFKVISKARSVLADETGLLSSVLRVVLVPFLIFDILFAIFFTMSVTLHGLPTIVNVFLYTPLVFIGILDYVIPMIRGN